MRAQLYVRCPYIALSEGHCVQPAPNVVPHILCIRESKFSLCRFHRLPTMTALRR